jgi:hypothetical protein
MVLSTSASVTVRVGFSIAWPVTSARRDVGVDLEHGGKAQLPSPASAFGSMRG